MKEMILVLGVAILIFMGGCNQKQLPENVEPKPAMVKVPTIDIEATVISLSLDTNIECEGKYPGYEYPKDTGVIKIDNILSIHNPNNWELKGIKEGNEIKVKFDYSARPAKIRMVPAGKTSTSSVPASETPISHIPTFAKPIPKEDGYFMYVIESTLTTEETETILPGLDSGSKFKATVSYSSPTRISVGKYKIIS